MLRKLLFGATVAVTVGLLAVKLGGFDDSKQVGLAPNRRAENEAKYGKNGGKFFTNSQGLRVYTQEWRSNDNDSGNDNARKKKKKAVVFIIHGYGEHCGRYEHLAKRLNENGYDVFSFDLQGHGRSEGDSAYVERAIDHSNDFWQYYDIVVNDTLVGEEKNLPRYLIGHSMGGLITLNSLLSFDGGERQKRFRGVVLSGPLVVPAEEVAVFFKPELVLLATYLSDILPKLPTDRLDATAVSRDPLVVAQYVSDPLNYHGGIKIRVGYELLATMTRLTPLLPIIEIPMLILQGESDRLVNPKGAKVAYDGIKSKDKRLRIFPKLYHELFHEPEKESIIGEVIAWLDEHLVD